MLEEKPVSGIANVLACVRCDPRVKRMTRECARISILTTTYHSSSHMNDANKKNMVELNEQIVCKNQSSRAWHKMNNLRNAQFDMKCGSGIAT